MTSGREVEIASRTFAIIAAVSSLDNCVVMVGLISVELSQTSSLVGEITAIRRS